MSSFVGTQHYDHRSAERTGVLVVNLGTPSAPTTAAVRRYLAEFLSDPRVIDIPHWPRWLWWLILHGIILRIRPSKSAHAYQQVWTEQGSPLMVYTQALATKLQRALNTALQDEIPLVVGMTYGEPSIQQALQQLRAANVTRLVVLPLYPQYSGSTTGSVFDSVTRVLQRWRWVPELRFINHYHDHAPFIQALAQRLRAHWQLHGPLHHQGKANDHLLLSFHGLPKRYLLNGDPYFCHCHLTARLLAQELGLTREQWSVSFQSRVGREEWLKPYTDVVLSELPKRGVKRVTVACPAFAVDCLETLEEIALRNREDFIAAGGEQFDYAPALNDSDVHVSALQSLLLSHLQGWPARVTHEGAAERAKSLMETMGA